MKYYIVFIVSIIVAAMIGYNIGHLRGSVFGMKKGLNHSQSFVEGMRFGMKQNFEKARYDVISAKGNVNDIEKAQREFGLEIDRIIIRLDEYRELHISKP